MDIVIISVRMPRIGADKNKLVASYSENADCIIPRAMYKIPHAIIKK